MLNIADQMFIHGGLTEDDKYLNDSYVLNLSPPLHWNKINIWMSEWPTLANHTCCLVLPYEMRINSKLSLYKLPEPNETNRHRYAKVYNYHLDY